jgi:hypothetical protein
MKMTSIAEDGRAKQASLLSHLNAREHGGAWAVRLEAVEAVSYRSISF